MASDSAPTNLLELLQKADQSYYNEDGSYMTDDTYDELRRNFKHLHPDHPYNKQVGADIRTGKEKLPKPMPSLNQIEIGDIEKWAMQLNAMSEFLVTMKLDGASALLEYQDGYFVRAFSRGDGDMGADITRHVKQIPGVPKILKGGEQETLHIRCEIIISIPNWVKMQEDGIVRGSNGQPYKNARNAASGMMNATSNTPKAYQYLSCIAYECLDLVTPENTKYRELHQLQEYGFEVTECYPTWTRNMVSDNRLAIAIDGFRQSNTYELDGTVVYVNDLSYRDGDTPGENPASAIKYKVASAHNTALAEVIDVQWNISKHGAYKPRVNINPTDLVGVTIQWATGFNAQFIVDNKIGPGALIRITRSGDVIPFIQKVVKPATDPIKLPQPGKWNATGVDWVTSIQDLLADEGADNDILVLEIKKQQLLDFFVTIGVDGLREGTITQLMQANIVNLVDIIKLPLNMWERLIGANGNKIHASLHAVLHDIEPWKLMGGFHSFGKGVGVRKFKALFKALGKFAHTPSVAQIVGVEGFEETTAHKIVNGMHEFRIFLQDIEGQYSFAEVKAAGTKFAGKQIVMTGFRDPDLETLIESEGGKVGSSVSSKTSVVIAKNPSDTSTKLKKARDNGIPVLSLDQFKSQYQL